MRNILRYLSRILLEEYLLLPVLASGSYLTTLGVDHLRGREEIMFNALPPLFWPVLSASIVLAGIWLKIRDYREDKKHEIKTKHEAYCERINLALYAVRELYITQGTGDVIFRAWENVKFVHAELIEKRGKEVVPPMINANDQKSVGIWYEFLVDERARCRKESEEKGL